MLLSLPLSLLIAIDRIWEKQCDLPTCYGILWYVPTNTGFGNKTKQNTLCNTRCFMQKVMPGNLSGAESHQQIFRHSIFLTRESF